MGLMDKLKGKPAPSVPAQATPATPPAGNVINLSKGGKINLSKDAPSSDGTYTLIASWGKKDYDLYALVEYTDGHVEVVSCFGTMLRPQDFQTRTKDGAVVHVTGDKTSADDAPREVITVRLNPNIKSVVPVVYSAKNSGTGSFRRYGVSTYVIPGIHQEVPQNVQMVSVEAANANDNDTVYTFVPGIITNGPDGAELTSLLLYSRPGSENRPVVRNSVVTMDAGEENSNKPK